MSYQAVVRDNSNQVVSNRTVRVRVGVLPDNANAASVYTETHQVVTNAQGVLALEIGGGTVSSGSYADIPWSKGKLFLKTELDPSGGTNYTLTGTTQLLTVPFSNYASEIPVTKSGDTVTIGKAKLLLPGSVLLGSGSITPPPPSPPAACPPQDVFNPNVSYGSLTDQEGNVYKTVVIGNQEWMAENLRTARYRNGDVIPYVVSTTSWLGLTSGATVWYNHDSTQFHCSFGRFYNWYAVTDPRKICPTGWHVPTDDDWTVLAMSLGGPSVAGPKMKSSTGWAKDNGTNSSGFTGRPSGYRSGDGNAYNQTLEGFWWSTLEAGNDAGFFRYLSVNFVDLGRSNWPKRGTGLSVRCLKD
jgi:uncharacterized protein (TIGR02145 family)